MRGIILAGGTGSRLGVLTKTINKHCLPVGALPMIYYPLMTLRNAGIKDITIVSTPLGVGQLAALLGSGHEHGCYLEYRVQDQPGGIADAMKCAYRGEDLDSVAVILGDNVFTASPMLVEQPTHRATCYLYKIEDMAKLKEFCVPTFSMPNYDPESKVVAVTEKPEYPMSGFAGTGLYVFGSGVWSMLRRLKPGNRGELELADLLDRYAKAQLLSHTIVGGFWGDAGTVEGMAECAAAVKQGGR